VERSVYPPAWRNVSLEEFEELGNSVSFAASDDPLESTSETEIAMALDGGAFRAAMEAIHIPQTSGSSWGTRTVEFDPGMSGTASASSSRRSWRGFGRSRGSITGGTVGSLRGVAEEDGEGAWDTSELPRQPLAASSEDQMPTVSAFGGSIRFAEQPEAVHGAHEDENPQELAANTTATTNSYTTFGDAQSTAFETGESGFARQSSRDAEEDGGNTKRSAGFGDSWGFVEDPANSWEDDEEESEEIQPLAAQAALFDEAREEPPRLRLFPVPAPIGRSQAAEEASGPSPQQLREQKPSDLYQLRVRARGERQRHRIIRAYG